MDKKGNQDPTRAVIIDHSASKGAEAVAIYDKSKRKALEWQRRLLDDIMAVRPDGLWTHSKFGYAVPRRNGKNEIVVMRELWGLHQGENIMHTAHRTSTSHASWERLVRVLEEAGYKKDEDYIILRATGREKVEFLNSGGRVDFRTRTTTGGLGEGFDLLIIDEAQEYTIDQETALKYVVTDSQNPQTIFCGTPPTMVSGGTVFTDFRKSTLAGDTFDGGWAEWSVEEESDPYDVDLWYETNPSLGTILSERAVRSEIGQDVLDFNIQRLGLWVKYNQKSFISEEEWDGLQVKATPTLTGKLHVGIKYAPDGGKVAMSVAVETLSGHVFVESIGCENVRKGNRWILDFIEKADVESVTIDGQSGQALLKKAMKTRKLIRPVLPRVSDVIESGSLFMEGIYKKKICHAGQPSLRAIASNCDKRPIGSGGGFGFKSLFDDLEAAMLESVVLAYWGQQNKKTKKKQRVWY
ncbi:terminase [Kallipyga massiliensis]|uniref:terminase n=1 Tax=Kallipyga massiliensis TaxID=1472764 RepID=UPI0004AED5D5|nr:terminase [Kallipyga massiliensis]